MQSSKVSKTGEKEILSCKLIEDEWDTGYTDPQDLKTRFKLIRSLGGGKSGSSVLLISSRKDNKKYVMKLSSGSDASIKNEYVIGCLLSKGRGARYFPKVYEVGTTSCPNPLRSCSRKTEGKYQYIISSYIEGNTIIDSELDYYQKLGILIQFVDAVTSVKGFVHSDGHLLNLIVSHTSMIHSINLYGHHFFFRAPKLTLIDFGWSTLGTHTTFIGRGKNIIFPPFMSFLTTTPSTARHYLDFWEAIKMTFSRDPVDLKYLRLISRIVLKQGLPEGVASFEGLVESEFFKILRSDNVKFLVVSASFVLNCSFEVSGNVKDLVRMFFLYLYPGSVWETSRRNQAKWFGWQDTFYLVFFVENSWLPPLNSNFRKFEEQKLCRKLFRARRGIVWSKTK